MENQATKPPMILVVEPDPMMLTGISAVLNQQGYRCFLSRDLSVAKKATENTAFDLFVLSVDDHLESAEAMARELHQQPNNADVPIVFLAPRLNPEWIGRLNAVGGVYCIPKPFDPNVMIELVRRAVWEPHLVQPRVAPPKAHFANDWVRLS